MDDDPRETLVTEFGDDAGATMYDVIVEFIEEFDRANDPRNRGNVTVNNIVEIIMWYIENPIRMSNRAIRQHNLKEAGENAYKSVLRKYYITFLFLDPVNERRRVQFLDIVAQSLAENRNNTVTCMLLDRFMREQIFRIHLPDQAALSKAMQKKSDAEIMALKVRVPANQEESGTATFANTSSTPRPSRLEEPSPVPHDPRDLLTHSAELEELILEADFKFKGNLKDPGYVQYLFDTVDKNLQSQGIQLQPAEFKAAIEEIILNRQLAQGYQGAAPAAAAGPASKGGKRHSNKHSNKHSKKYSNKHSNKHSKRYSKRNSKRNSKKRSKRHFRH